MNADDLLTCNKFENGIQSQFDTVEDISEKGVRRISYKKTELITFRNSRERRRSEVVNSWTQRFFNELSQDCIKYLGFYAQVRGFKNIGMN